MAQKVKSVYSVRMNSLKATSVRKEPFFLTMADVHRQELPAQNASTVASSIVVE